MRIKPLRAIELAVHSWRNRFIIKPLAKNRLIRREVEWSKPRQFLYAVEDLGDHRVAFDPNDRVISAAIMRGGHWHRDEFNLIVSTLRERKLLDQPKIFLDIGAHIGTQTIYALRSGRFSRSIMFEPVPFNIDCLKINAMLNRLEDRIELIEAAVSDAPGQLPIALDDVNSGGHSLKQKPSSSKPIWVNVVTVGSILAQQNVSPEELGLVWLDVEGYEPKALRGMQEILAARVPICVEYHGHDYSKDEATELLRLLAAHYREAAVVNGKRLVFQPASRLRPHGQGIDLLFV